MRFALVSSLVLLFACGGSNKPADAPSTDTSSLEANGASSSKETPPATDSTAAPPSPGAATSAPAEDAPAPTRPAPSVTGSIDGKPFAPTLARVSAKMQKDGRILLSLDEGADCSSSSDASLTLVVPWQDGYKADLGSLKRSTRKGQGEIGFSRAAAGGKKQMSKTFKPSGTVTIVKAPMEVNAVGKMKIDLQSGDYMLAGDLDIQVCVAPK
jgi:hypothetical protein